jgi:hypothetical protein
MTNIVLIKNVIAYDIRMNDILLYELKCPCNLWKSLELLLTLHSRIKDENVAIKQT